MATLRLRSGQGQVKSGQILKLVVWTKIGVYSIQLSTANSTIPFSSFSVVKNFQKCNWKFWFEYFLKFLGRFGYQILMDFLKIWYVGSRHEVLWHIFRFFQISKIFGFYKGFPKNIDFSKFWGSKTQNFEISR